MVRARHVTGIRETGQVQEIGKAMESKALRFTEYRQLASYMQGQSLLFDNRLRSLFFEFSVAPLIYLFIIYLHI